MVAEALKVRREGGGSLWGEDLDPFTHVHTFILQILDQGVNRSAAERRQAYAVSALLAAAAVAFIASIPLFDMSQPIMLTLLLLAVVAACLLSALSVLLLLKVLSGLHALEGGSTLSN